MLLTIPIVGLWIRSRLGTFNEQARLGDDGQVQADLNNPTLVGQVCCKLLTLIDDNSEMLYRLILDRAMSELSDATTFGSVSVEYVGGF